MGGYKAVFNPDGTWTPIAREMIQEQSDANSRQVGGEHYRSKAIQPWDYIVANDMPFLEGCIVKYVSRYKGKGGLKDLEKARHFLDKLIEVESAKAYAEKK